MFTLEQGERGLRDKGDISKGVSSGVFRSYAATLLFLSSHVACPNKEETNILDEQVFG